MEREAAGGGEMGTTDIGANESNGRDEVIEVEGNETLARQMLNFELQTILLRCLRDRKCITITSPLDTEELCLLMFLTGACHASVKFGVRFKSGIRLCRQDYRRFLHQEGEESWMSDNVMNCFFDLINDRNRKRSGSYDKEFHLSPTSAFSSGRSKQCIEVQRVFNGRRCRIWTSSTYFYEMLKRRGSCAQPDNIRRWLGLSRDTKAETMERIMVPVILNSSHWVLVLADVGQKVLMFIDPMKSSASASAILDSLAPLCRYMEDFGELRDEEVGGSTERVEWKRIVNPNVIPRQRDNSSCGVFVMFLAETVERSVYPSFSQNDIQTLRWRAAVSLAAGLPGGPYKNGAGLCVNGQDWMGAGTGRERREMESDVHIPEYS